MGWNRNEATSTNIPNRNSSASSNRKIKFSVVLVIVICLAGLLALFVSRVPDEKPLPEEERNSPIREAEQTPVQNDKTIDGSSVQVDISTNLVEQWLGHSIVKRTVETNQQIIVETIFTDDGKKHLWYHEPRQNILPSAADQLLAMMTSDDSGTGAPPLPDMPNFEEEFVKALKTEIVINPDDPPNVKEVKERVLAARQELNDLMAQGIPAKDVIKEYKRVQEDNATLRLEAVERVQSLLATGDEEGAQQLCDEYNNVLRKAGIMEIELPMKRDRVKKGE